MKKVWLFILVSLLAVALMSAGAAEMTGSDDAGSGPMVGPGGTNPNSEPDTPIVGPGGTNPNSEPDTPIVGPGGTNPNWEPDTPIVGPGGINPNPEPDTPIVGPGGIYDPGYIDNPVIHVYMYVNTSNGKHLNVRQSPDSQAAIVGALEYGEQVLVTGYEQNRTWARILYGSADRAYVLARYLSSNPPGPRPVPTATPYVPPYYPPYYPPYQPTAAPYYPPYQPYSPTAPSLAQLNQQFNTMQLTNGAATVTIHPPRVGGYVPLYWAPDTQASVIRYCTEGESFSVVAYNSEWLLLRDNQSGMTGYVTRSSAF